MTPLRIAMVVHGRFHAFDLARALLHRGHAVTLLTNHPPVSPKRFGIPARHVISCWLEGFVDRVAGRLASRGCGPYPEAFLYTWFGRWAAVQTVRKRWDLVYGWSGISEEWLRASRNRPGLKTIVRGSSHIRTQARILEEERRRTGLSIQGPSPWIIRREEREYALADRIVVLSRFAAESFVAQGFPADKLFLLPLGVQREVFAQTPETVEARCRRILSGSPLRLLYVGSLTLRKGLWDLAEVARRLDPRRFRIQLVGAPSSETSALLAQLGDRIERVPSQPQSALPRWYSAADLFVFPTLEDGFANVLAQAHANALPVLTTRNCGGPDLLEEGRTGWLLPIRTPEAFVDRLRWCDEHRDAVATMVRTLARPPQPRSWEDAARDLERLCAS